MAQRPNALAEAQAEIARLREQLDAARVRVAELEARLEAAAADFVSAAPVPVTAGRIFCAHCGERCQLTSRGHPRMYCSTECRKAAAAERNAAGPH